MENLIIRLGEIKREETSGQETKKVIQYHRPSLVTSKRNASDTSEIAKRVENKPLARTRLFLRGEKNT